MAIPMLEGARMADAQLKRELMNAPIDVEHLRLLACKECMMARATKKTTASKRANDAAKADAQHWAEEKAETAAKDAAGRLADIIGQLSGRQHAAANKAYLRGEMTREEWRKTVGG